ncbi:LmeA family phospholipid-binding protein [Rhizomonospora bruguierae]|uniref:LmeA family phospholipid-binding protein n=1 Tax=Rhizomonospora bruguierae TaxID=1581705 RepID=UPI001BCA978C|nr:DUF2993 domain-containing protein [Micromonospora sp. NBRC 107566]
MTDDPEYAHASPRRRRGGRRWGLVLLVFVLVVGGLLVVGDRVAAHAAERVIADQARQELARRQVSAGEPEVTVGGFPFLTQVLDEKFKKITIVFSDVSGEGLQLPKLTVEATNVVATRQTLMNGTGRVVAQNVRGTATVGYASVTELIKKRVNLPDLTLSEKDGKLHAVLPTQILNRPVTLNGTADLTVKNGVVQVRFRQLTAEGLDQVPLAKDALTRYAQQLSLPVQIPALPFGLRITEVKPLAEGLAISGSADNVPLNG